MIDLNGDMLKRSENFQQSLVMCTVSPLVGDLVH